MTTEPNHPKNQHYVPQFLLRNFASPATKRIHVFDKLQNKGFETTTRNVAAEGGFYDTEGEGEPQSLEPLMSFLEENAAPVIQGILDQESIGHLSHEDRVKVSFFAAVQRMRVKGVRQRIKSINEGLLDELARRGINGGDVVPRMSDSDIKHGSLAQIGDAKEHAMMLRRKAWVLQRAPEGLQFYTSDNPVTLHNLVTAPQRGGLGLESPGVEIYLPIGSRYNICFLCRQTYQLILDGLRDFQRNRTKCDLGDERVDPLKKIVAAVESGDPDDFSPENVDHQNSLQVRYSSRFIFSSDGDFGLVKSMLDANPDLGNPPRVTVL